MLPKHLELCCECSQETSQRISSEARQVEKMAEHHLNLHKNRLRIESKMKGVMNTATRLPQSQHSLVSSTIKLNSNKTTLAPKESPSDGKGRLPNHTFQSNSFLSLPNSNEICAGIAPRSTEIKRKGYFQRIDLQAFPCCCNQCSETLSRKLMLALHTTKSAPISSVKQRFDFKTHQESEAARMTKLP